MNVTDTDLMERLVLFCSNLCLMIFFAKSLKSKSTVLEMISIGHCVFCCFLFFPVSLSVFHRVQEPVQQQDKRAAEKHL